MIVAERACAGAGGDRRHLREICRNAVGGVCFRPLHMYENGGRVESEDKD